MTPWWELGANGQEWEHHTGRAWLVLDPAKKQPRKRTVPGHALTQTLAPQKGGEGGAAQPGIATALGLSVQGKLQTLGSGLSGQPTLLPANPSSPVSARVASVKAVAL